MELLYIWINRSENGVFRKADINISSIYSFSFDGNTLTESQHTESNDSHPNIFNEYAENIVNITALIGKNGAGKTTLFKYLMDHTMPHPLQNENRPDYKKHFDIEDEKKKTIFIVKEKNAITAYHNLEVIKIDSAIITREIHVERGDCFTTLLRDNPAYANTSLVYLTNSQYSPDGAGFSSARSIDDIDKTTLSKIHLTPKSIETLSNKFYETITSFPSNQAGIIAQNKQNIVFDHVQRIVVKSRTPSSFQQVCDLLYYHYTFSDKMKHMYWGKSAPSIRFTFTPLLWLIEETIPGVDGMLEADSSNLSSLDNSIKTIHQTTKKLLSNTFQSREYNVVLVLLQNLLIELLCVSGNIQHIDGIEDIDSLKSFITDEIHEIGNHSPFFTYFQNAYKEIIDLDHILSECNYYEDYLPFNDMAKRVGVVLDSSTSLEEYRSFLDYIYQCFESGTSYILKYINVTGLAMSSGERALLNMFSWLYLLPDFKRIDKNVDVLNKNVILLIDEIDLYMHPEWQRRTVKYLLDEISLHFPTHCFQILIATHSPFVLSDIPRLHTIYLDGIGEVRDHIESETFAANIYDLLKDGFYLDNAIGAFATVIINGLILDVSRKGTQENSSLVDKIEMIGTPIIRNKLLEKYSQGMRKEVEPMNAIQKTALQQTIQLLSEQKSQIEQQIQILEDLQ